MNGVYPQELLQYGNALFATLGVTYFDNTFDNMVGWDSETSSYKNVFKATSRGLELNGR